MGKKKQRKDPLRGYSPPPEKMSRTAAYKFAWRPGEVEIIPAKPPEMGVQHADGSVTDAEIHEAILNNPEAELAQARRAYKRALDQGLDEGVARELYLPKGVEP